MVLLALICAALTLLLRIYMVFQQDNLQVQPGFKIEHQPSMIL